MEYKSEKIRQRFILCKVYVDIINEIGKQAKLAVLLPVTCAIGTS